ncbi:MAG: hypothetical protein KTR26_01955 [Flammeovirgaceae bacterium]|nr:hypothetical protein [Flammeovirgaceae bacterium]
MWKINKIQTTNLVERYQILFNEIPITNKDFMDNLSDSKEFRNFYNAVLKDCSFPAFFWENKSVTLHQIDEPYEFVLVNSSSLVNQSPDATTFANQFSKESSITSFSNLGGDAHLVVPCPISRHQNYTHLAKFVRSGLTHQIDAFWKKVGEEYSKAIGKQPKWLSTAGMGVFWLHVRIDTRPKYYRYSEYK